MGIRTDYTESKIIDKRYMEAVRRGDRQLISVKIITPKFDSNFDIFAANVAFELRHRVYYRSDGGKIARGLVRATGDLAILHKLFLTNNPRPATGARIKLNAIFIRRKDSKAHMRWVIAIRFNNTNDFKFVDGDTYVVDTPDVSSTQAKMMKKYLSHAHEVVKKMPDPYRSRIEKMLDVADRVGYPANWDLFIYYSGAVFIFMDWRIKTPDEETNPDSPRRKMTTATNGQVPFKGSAGSIGDWQIFPIREMVLACAKHQSLEDCDADIHNHLKQLDAEIEKTFDAVIKRTNEVSQVPTSMWKFWDVPPESLVGPLGFRFHKHLVGLLKDKHSLYSSWK